MLVILLVCEWSATVTLNIMRNKLALILGEAQMCVTHLPLPKPTSPHLPISYVKLNLQMVVVGGKQL